MQRHSQARATRGPSVREWSGAQRSGHADKTLFQTFHDFGGWGLFLFVPERGELRRSPLLFIVTYFHAGVVPTSGGIGARSPMARLRIFEKTARLKKCMNPRIRRTQP